MENSMQCFASLIYMNNVHKIKLADIPYNLNDTAETILPQIVDTLNKSNHAFDNSKGRLYISKSNDIFPFEKSIILDETQITVLYSEVAALNNAVNYDEVDGITFFFHTNEKNHMYQPHIHASYSGKTISISLKDYTIMGNFKNPKKIKTAINYVKENIDDLLQAWEKWTIKN